MKSGFVITLLTLVLTAGCVRSERIVIENRSVWVNYPDFLLVIEEGTGGVMLIPKSNPPAKWAEVVRVLGEEPIRAMGSKSSGIVIDWGRGVCVAPRSRFSTLPRYRQPFDPDAGFQAP